MTNEKKKIRIYCKGTCKGTKGELIWVALSETLEVISHGLCKGSHKSGPRAEFLAVKEALEQVPKLNDDEHVVVGIYTSSEYVSNALNGMYDYWESTGKLEGKKNIDIIGPLVREYMKMDVTVYEDQESFGTELVDMLSKGTSLREATIRMNTRRNQKVVAKIQQVVDANDRGVLDRADCIAEIKALLGELDLEDA